MSQNPYEATTTTDVTTRARPKRWMIVVGCILLGLAAVCLLATIAMMVFSFGTMASSTSTPKPSELASGISAAMMASFAGVPLGVAGIVFLILGLVRRQPAVSA